MPALTKFTLEPDELFHLLRYISAIRQLLSRAARQVGAEQAPIAVMQSFDLWASGWSNARRESVRDVLLVTMRDTILSGALRHVDPLWQVRLDTDGVPLYPDDVRAGEETEEVAA